MTKKEITEIIELLKGFYPNALPADDMIKAWANLIDGFDSKITKNAIVELASQDTRETADMPAPGVIYQAIKKAHTLYEGIKEIAKEGFEYENLNETAKNLVSKERYNKLLLMDGNEIDSVEIQDLAK